ncbi:CPBP family intramembrane metalloprotease [Luteibacter pinisoli]|uniref:CPBP family intramembrane metalloprotease n=1 Tax=Luteibacter pinisoli TaxID=2589080 RepID=A0A4Y5Z925_9GAMM|nr:type II CAAX endopeptidase family protein [Luteibacter pinisoli]QDE40663.1 CPBP family intramembrane metalloprotease [Luteibacter pinisoli]
MPAVDRKRVVIAFVVLCALYNLGEGIGGHVFHSLAIVGACLVAMLAAAWPLGRWLGFKGYDAYALEWRRSTFLLLSGGLVMALLLKYTAVCVGMALGVYTARPPETAAAAAMSFASSLPWALVVTFVPSMAEDLLTRGFLYRAMRVQWVSWVFVVVSAVFYMVNHVYRMSAGVGEWLMLFCFGLAYATAVVRAGTLWLAVGLHWGWNLANQLIDTVLPYDIALPAWSPILSAAAHVVMLGVLFAVPTNLEGDDLHADPA